MQRDVVGSVLALWGWPGSTPLPWSWAPPRVGVSRVPLLNSRGLASTPWIFLALSLIPRDPSPPRLSPPGALQELLSKQGTPGVILHESTQSLTQS